MKQIHKPTAPKTVFNRLRTKFAREDGSASIHFVIIMPLAIAIFFASVESGVITLRKTYLDRALEMTVRELRLGLIDEPTVAKLRTKICARMAMVTNCETNLTMELHVRSVSSTVLMSVPTTTDLCVNRTTSVEPVLTFQAGVANDLVLVRACLLQDIIFPTSKSQIAVGDTVNGKYQLISTTAFVNEPS